jgi:hypothetical protein
VRLLNKKSLAALCLLGYCLHASAAPRKIENNVEVYSLGGKNFMLMKLADTAFSTLNQVDVPAAALKSIVAGQLALGALTQTGPLKIAAAYGQGTVIVLTLAEGEAVRINLKLPLRVRFDSVPFGSNPTDTVDIPEADHPIVVAAGKTAPKVPMFKAASGKSDAQLYFDGEISHVRTGNVIGSYDLKLSHNSYFNFLGRVASQTPLFTLTGGDTPKADPDSMQLGWTLSVPLLVTDYRAPLLGIIWQQTPQIESTRNYTYSNFVYSSVFQLVSRTWGSPATGPSLSVLPYLGVDVGRNLSTTVAVARDQTILRPLTGGTLNLSLFKIKSTSVTITGDYVRRWPVTNEVLLSTNSAGNIVTASAGTKPRDHVKTGLSVSLNTYTCLTIAYERGALPPAFQFVDNKWTLSLVLKAKN